MGKRQMTPELVKICTTETRGTGVWRADVQWFAKTGAHTRTMILIFEEERFLPKILTDECKMQRAIHEANGLRGRPCSCAWCRFDALRRPAFPIDLPPELRAVARTDRVWPLIDTSRTCRKCGAKTDAKGLCSGCGAIKVGVQT